MGLFATAVSRAADDLDIFEPLYFSFEERRSVKKLAMSISDRCLELALSVDRLNDLQLASQYENLHLPYMRGWRREWVSGHPSPVCRLINLGYAAWRTQGDVISSIHALGYQECIGSEADTPAFLIKLRRTVLARICSAAINVAIFLGRPSRLRKDDLHTRVRPDVTISTSKISENDIGVASDTYWSAGYAMIKEDILMLHRQIRPNRNDLLARQGRSGNFLGCILTDTHCSTIRETIATHWRAVPAELRLEHDLTLCHRTPIERDLPAAVRMQHLHVHFLLELALAGRVSEPPGSLLKAAADLLHLVVQAVVLKQHLMSSGTQLTFKVLTNRAISRRERD